MTQITFNSEATFLAVSGHPKPVPARPQHVDEGARSDPGPAEGGANTIVSGANVNVSILDVLSGEVCASAEVGEGVSTIGWAGQSLYIGAKTGSVFLMEYSNSSFVPFKQILALDSEVVQITGNNNLLACSTLTRAVICNHIHKTYREIGSKLRQGVQGVAVQGGRVWSARPGCRLWEVEETTGNVLATRQYRKVMTDGTQTAVQDPANSKPAFTQGDVVQHGFSHLYTSNHHILSYNSSGVVYILNMQTYTVQAWTHLNHKIRQLSVSGNLVLVLDPDGCIHNLRFGTLDRLMFDCYSIELWAMCRPSTNQQKAYQDSRTGTLEEIDSDEEPF